MHLYSSRSGASTLILGAIPTYLITLFPTFYPVLHISATHRNKQQKKSKKTTTPVMHV